MPLAPGFRLGPYEVVDLIGAGGMGKVYTARDVRLGRTVAVKILPPELAADPQFRERFDREAKSISSLAHPHICALYDVGEVTLPNPAGIGPDTPLRDLVLEHLEGESLATRLGRGALRCPTRCASGSTCSARSTPRIGAASSTST